MWSKREKIPAWNTWEKYHKEAQQSVGFSDDKRLKAPLTIRNEQLYENAKPVYELIMTELEQSI